MQELEISEQNVCDVFQECISDILWIHRVENAIIIGESLSIKINDSSITGGVAPNNFLREKLKTYFYNNNNSLFLN